ncbi:ATP12 family chaperone protein [uncultured Roseovarius sp.]|uniref:ATP12 family chaperone protein n=1 Tax=uncultured Roseovarius sp. TaxID=293344 RepID=UPI002630E2BA|nr:ATP12 family protein [uncultured Roseovarius sp.]
MSNWKLKRFWDAAAVRRTEQGFAVELDGRPVKTPAKTTLIVPTQPLANQIAAEWNAAEGQINPADMPFTRSANAAIDKVTHQHAEVADMLAAYGDADLTCYRADGPQELVTRQAEGWDPLLDWADTTLGARLLPVQGVIHSPQDTGALRTLADQVHALDPFALTAFHDLVSLSGSLVIGFAALHNLHPPEALWRLSRIDELWQEEQWGEDEEAQEMAARKESDFLHAKTFYNLSCSPH